MKQNKTCKFSRKSAFSSYVQLKNRRRKNNYCNLSCVSYVLGGWRKKKKKDFLENLHVLSCFVQFKSILLISCVFWTFIIIIIINPLTVRVVGAPQKILQPVFSIFDLRVHIQYFQVLTKAWSSWVEPCLAAGVTSLLVLFVSCTRSITTSLSRKGKFHDGLENRGNKQQAKTMAWIHR